MVEDLLMIEGLLGIWGIGLVMGLYAEDYIQWYKDRRHFDDN